MREQALATGTSEQIEKNAPDVLTLSEAAVLLRCSKAHISNVINGRVTGIPHLPHISLGRRVLIRRIALERWIESLEDSGDQR
jgi:excisionase family DNA binding protein